MTIYNPMSKEFQEDVKKLGLTGNQYIKKLRDEGKIKSNKKIADEWAQKRGYKDYSDYQNKWVQEKGFENHWTYQKDIFWDNAKRGSPDYFKGRICSKCGNNETKCGWYCDGKEGYLCGNCAGKEYYYISDWRIGQLDPYSTTGKGFIGQQIVAKTLGIDDCNLIMDNFNFYIDLSGRSGYGIIQVKTATLIGDMWSLSKIRNRKFHTLFGVCMDEYEPWKDVDRMYAIPVDELYKHNCEDGVNVYKDWSKLKKLSRFEWVEKFRIDDNPFNDTYHNMSLENCKILRKDK